MCCSDDKKAWEALGIGRSETFKTDQYRNAERGKIRTAYAEIPRQRQKQIKIDKTGRNVEKVRW